MAEQLVFDLPARTSHARGDFFVSEANRLAVRRLDATGDWPGARLALVGPEGAGKTHLALVWAEATGAAVLEGADLAGAGIATIATPVAIEAGDGRFDDAGEEALFHLLNRMAAAGLPVLLVGRAAPARWPVRLADLRSRLAATDVARIAAPDDALLAAVLVKLFADRQLLVTPALIGWLVARMDRSFAEAQRLVAALDAAALAESRAVTQRLAQSVLDIGPAGKR